MVVEINRKKCDSLPSCICAKICPTQAFVFEIEKSGPKVFQEKCISCGKCVLVCPHKAVSMD